MLTQTYSKTGEATASALPLIEENKFTEMAVGLGVDIGAIAGLDNKILLQGSFSRATESAYLERQATHIVAGLTADVWGPISVLAGFQQYNKQFGKGGARSGLAFEDPTQTINLTDATESLILGGVRVKIAPMSYISLQYGILNNELSCFYNAFEALGNNTFSVSKNVLLADVTVNF
jgi:hypothetical protein